VRGLWKDRRNYNDAVRLRCDGLTLLGNSGNTRAEAQRIAPTSPLAVSDGKLSIMALTNALAQLATMRAQVDDLFARTGRIMRAPQLAVGHRVLGAPAASTVPQLAAAPAAAGAPQAPAVSAPAPTPVTTTDALSAPNWDIARPTLDVPFASAGICSPMPINRLFGEGGLRIEMLESPQIVFKHSTDACVEHDIPDAHAHAVRRANGDTVVFSTEYEHNYSLVGSSLYAARRVRAPTYTSAYDLNFDAAKFAEWVFSPYTYDGTNMWALVHNEWYGDPMQPPANLTLNSITLVASTDGGVTWWHPTDYIIRRPTPYTGPYPPVSRVLWGSFAPSNIINGGDGYRYAFFMNIRRTDQSVEGSCLLRSPSIGIASSWQVFTASGWQPTIGSDPDAAVSVVASNCQVTSIGYNSYLRKFFALCTAGPWLCYSLADTVAGPWTPLNVIMRYCEDDLLHTSFMPGESLLSYPSLIDPDDPDQNYQTPGRNPYIYFTWYHYNSTSNYDRDLIRQRLYLTLLPPPMEA
jgi:hypothetical protein